MSGSFSSRSLSGLTIFTLSLLLLIAALTLFGNSLISVRLNEMDILLENAARNSEQNRGFLITAKLRQLQRRLKRLGESEDDFLREVKINQVVEFEYNNGLYRTRDQGYPLARFLTGLVRVLLGKPWSLTARRPLKNLTLQQAYILELKKDYPGAIQRYEKTQQEGRHKGTAIEDYIRLHLVFCYAMLGQYDTAVDQCTPLISGETDQETRMIAEELLDFLVSARKQWASIQKEGGSLLARAEAAYYYRDFKTATRLLKQALAGKRAAQRAQARYLLGRCHEDQGRLKQAIREYTEVMLIDMNSFWAKQANRRLFMVGRFYEKNKRLVRIARDNSRGYRDEKFFRKVEHIINALPQPEAKGGKKEIPGQGNKITKKMEEDLERLSFAARERLKGLNSAQRKEVKLLAKHYKEVVSIAMRDGNVFVGAIIKQNANRVTAATVFGTLSLQRSDIRNIRLLYRTPAR